MKFDFIIGNPPYQEEISEEKPYAAPLYDKFLNNTYKISDHVEMIHPARFLFNAGGTPKAWNKQMLNDPHLRVLWHEPDSSKVFPNTDIKGGIAITYRAADKVFGAIETFIPFPQMNSIKEKVWAKASASMENIVANRGQYRFSDLAYEECPEDMEKTADRRIAPSAFDRMPNLFTELRPNDGHDYVQIYGNCKNSRYYKWFRKDYLNSIEALHKYKVIIPKATGSGTFGEVISTPVIGKPLIGHTETYISVGSVNTEKEARAILKYIKSKFARAMLSILKITQNFSSSVWKYVPLQDFTKKSDIDWSKSIKEIDQQLYKKYNLNNNEIAFIESHVKEME